MAVAASESFGLSVVKDKKADLGIPSHWSGLNFFVQLLYFVAKFKQNSAEVDIIQLQFRLIFARLLRVLMHRLYLVATETSLKPQSVGLTETH